MIEGVSRESIENQEYGGRDHLGAGALQVTELRCHSYFIRNIQCVTLVLPTKVSERVMLLERFVGVFKQCKQLLSNKNLQLK